jgi:hypothetical protein
MKHALKSLVIASALLMAGAAQAEVVEGTLTTGGNITALGWKVDGLTGGGTLTFSSSLIAALNAGGIQVAKINPATVNVTMNTRMKYTAISANAPVASLTGLFDGSKLDVTRVTTRGGASMLAEEDGITNTGGSLGISSISVNIAEKRIYADIDGGNGVGFKEQIHLWNYANLAGPVSFAAVVGPITSTNTVTGLTITTEAFGLFTKSLGLTEDGISAMSKITDYGTMVATIGANASKVGGTTPTIPEPSTYALMGIGLAALAFAAKRNRRA